MDETELGVKTLDPLEEHKLLKFLSLDKKFDLDLIQAFYCNLKEVGDGLERRLRNKLIKFMLKYFDTHFGLWAKGSEVCISNAHYFVKFDLVKSISIIDY